MASSDRNWTVDADPFLVGPEELQEAIYEAVTVLSRIGGAVIIAAQREEVAPEMYATTALMFRWTSYAPAKRLPKEQPVEEPVTEEDPVAA